jgi:predicted enzyme related to lactoylglutathione lyase
MLSDSRFEVNIPAGDIERAKAFYADKLGLTPSSEPVPGYVRYETTSGTPFNIYQTQYAGSAGHTIAQIHVDDVEKEVVDLKARGVAFEVYDDMPGVEWRGEVAVMAEMGKAAWFKDSEGNILCIDEPAGSL